MTRACTRGVVYAEFLIAFFPLFALFTCTAQLAFIAQAALVVRHAAECAARKAVVVLDDDPVHYDDEPRNALVAGERDGLSSLTLDVLELIAGAPLGEAPQTIPKDQPVQDGARLAAVRSAAYLPLASVSPPPELWRAALGKHAGTPLSIEASLGDSPWLRVVAGALYVRFASALSFPRALAAPELRAPGESFGRNDPVVTRVTFVYPCTLPLAAQLVCTPLLDLAGFAARAKDAAVRIGRGELREGVSDLEGAGTELRQSAADRMQLVNELAQAELPALAVAWLAATGQHVAVLRADAALPNQAAPYKYASERAREKEARR